MVAEHDGNLLSCLHVMAVMIPSQCAAGAAQRLTAVRLRPIPTDFVRHIV